MNTHNSSPHAQNAVGPDNVSNVSAAAMMAASDPTMTGLDPIRWSTNPPSTAPTAATTLAAAPKIRTSAWVSPYALTPSTAPKAKMAASPSRNIALATRK
ncbi:Uncharacterised protein [Mycobacterium tuberculosis]|uniref:Uncharacterized protein n=1 Tax=Mycobacterium tuberculosis TaxID=1773 RepID=A0A655FYI4_MYCTX|nr:Uncharacterised protein [Mycobacterium tuberculosis]CNW70163.1 Uncharacterised protein [Mycobacterium tuberculosis]